MSTVYDIDQAGDVLCTYSNSGSVSSIGKPRSGHHPDDDGSGKTKAEKTHVPWGKAVFYAFLPAGFPHTVTDDYLAYQTYDSLQAFSSSIASLLANRAVLEGLGVGNASQSPTAALVLKIIQDTFSRMATILFAHRMGQAIEPECKTYRFMADLFNDSALLLDLLTPVLPFFPKVCVMVMSSILRALCGVAANASKASLSAHFAKTGNLAELNAKEASQETVISLLGMLAGTAVVHMVEDRTVVLYWMVLLIFVHLNMNYRGVRHVKMLTLNRQRATIVFREYLETGQILSPTEVSQREHVLHDVRGELRSKSGDYHGYCEVGTYGSVMLSRPNLLWWGSGGSAHSYKFETDEYFMSIWHWRSRFVIRLAMKESAHAMRSEKTIAPSTSETEAMLLAWFDAVTHAYHFDSALKNGLGGHYENEGPQGYVSSEVKQTILATLRSVGWDVSDGQLETTSPVRVRVSNGASGSSSTGGDVKKTDHHRAGQHTLSKTD
ncbi:hypothetical protein F503_08642 [Ophiostoma piceae UAMH 11346]|uniref:Protein root UVB sensitive/RUS domain-containing protein n=1 Tax=Ophiostoma piceae (strain UAMH 11346) TaxID=1262450 RepID=S3C9W8_OPHP1|nr:hypothetical protein F503_08642 [Ophiostoma piceae UAMH 11346]